MLFLNNAINHGVLTPLGINQSAETGQSILFLLEANPGPGVGLLIAYSIFGTGLAKSTAPAAAIIQFFGGIHEIYFPYVLMKPLTLIATIAGGMVGILTLTIFNAGLRALFLSIGYLGWFISPYVFIASTVIIIVALLRRQFFSEARRAIMEENRP